MIYFLTVTFTTVGYGDITPGDWVSRGVTCVFMVYGCIAIASCFAVLVGSIIKAQDDAIHRATQALVESLPDDDDDGSSGAEAGGGRKPKKHLSIKQVQDMELKEVYSKLFWLALELLVLIFIGAAVMVPWENWSVNIGVFWAVQTLFGVGCECPSSLRVAPAPVRLTLNSLGPWSLQTETSLLPRSDSDGETYSPPHLPPASFSALGHGKTLMESIHPPWFFWFPLPGSRPYTSPSAVSLS